MAKVSFIGLGVMGYPMAGHLCRAGHEVIVFNRSPEKSSKWVSEHGGSSASSPSEAAGGCDFVFSCVGNDDDVRSVTLDEGGAFESMKPGSVFVDHTTASAEIARELSAAASQRGFHFLDAPVSGGQSGAENGILTVMVGGESSVLERAEPIISCYARTVGLTGPSGCGQIAKMVNQICIAGMVQGLAEGIHFAQKAGLDVGNAMGILSGGAASSWQMINRWETMDKAEYDHGFAVDWMRKDLGIALQEARANGSRLPVAALVDQFYAEIQAMGGNRWDTSSLLARLKRES